MSSLDDRHQSILGRRRTAEPASKPKHTRTPRSPHPSPEPQPPKPGDPLAEFRAFPRNTRLHAEFYLQEGYVHPDAHLVIRERLLAWVEHVEAGDEEMRRTLQAEIVPANPTSQRSGKILFEDPQISSTFSVSKAASPLRWTKVPTPYLCRL